MSAEFKRILCPTDFSEMSIEALKYARDLAKTFNGELHCLHVVDEAYQYWSSMGPESIPVGPPAEDLIGLGESRMRNFADEHLAGIDPPPKTVVLLGRPFAEIVSYARENEIQLIVMATHGRGGIVHALLGSTTEKVVRKAPCAVLTFRPEDQEIVMP
ncbi:MAG: universal stress protein [Phycisphaerales bacterium]|nr:MAG: universal stress protein [Phycisphaerales bacterium]